MSRYGDHLLLTCGFAKPREFWVSFAPPDGAEIRIYGRVCRLTPEDIREATTKTANALVASLGASTFEWKDGIPTPLGIPTKVLYP